MSNKAVVHVAVEAKSRFGILNKVDGKWLNTKDADLLAKFKIGSEYDVEMVESEGKDGKTYMNISSIASVSAPAKAAAPAKRFVPVKAADVSSAHMYADNKDQRILFQGLTQAVLQSPLMTYAKKGEEITYVESIVVPLAAMVKRLAA